MIFRHHGHAFQGHNHQQTRPVALESYMMNDLTWQFIASTNLQLISLTPSDRFMALRGIVSLVCIWLLRLLLRLIRWGIITTGMLWLLISTIDIRSSCGYWLMGRLLLRCTICIIFLALLLWIGWIWLGGLSSRRVSSIMRRLLAVWV